MKTRFHFFVVPFALGIALAALFLRSGEAGKAETLSKAKPSSAGEYAPVEIIPDVPMVASIERMGPASTGAETVEFKVTFSEPVTGVDMGDFAPVTRGVGFALVTDVRGSGSTYFVSVYTGYGDGMLGLSLADYDTIMGETGEMLGGVGTHNGDFAMTEMYEIVKSAQ